MREHRVGSLLVMDGQELAGIFTERDVLIRVLQNKLDTENILIEEVMTKDPEILHDDDPIAFALNLMSVGSYRHVPIVDDSESPVGIISVKDVFRNIAESFS